MRFTPKTEAELNSFNLLEKGIYKFYVFEAKDRLSKSNKEMIELKLKIENEGREHYIFDYLLEAMGYKLRHFATCSGMLDKYETGELKASDCIAKKGYVEIIVQPGNMKPEGGYYPDKNAVKDYVVTGNAASPIAAHAPEFSDDIPF